jgi:hypothetical protein
MEQDVISVLASARDASDSALNYFESCFEGNEIAQKQHGEGIRSLRASLDTVVELESEFVSLVRPVFTMKEEFAIDAGWNETENVGIPGSIEEQHPHEGSSDENVGARVGDERFSLLHYDLVNLEKVTHEIEGNVDSLKDGD